MPHLHLISITITTCLLLNVFFLFGTLNRLISANKPVKYTFLDRDNPLVLPIPPDQLPIVDITFQESSRFDLFFSNSDLTHTHTPRTEELKHKASIKYSLNSSNFIPDRKYNFSGSPSGSVYDTRARSRSTDTDSDSRASWSTLTTNQFGIGFQHLPPYHFRSITATYHALHCLHTIQLQLRRPLSSRISSPQGHYIHCLTYIRQLFLCNGDGRLEEGDFMLRNWETDRVGVEGRKCRDWNKVGEWVDKEFEEWLEWNGLSLADLNGARPDLSSGANDDF